MLASTSSDTALVQSRMRCCKKRLASSFTASLMTRGTRPQPTTRSGSTSSKKLTVSTIPFSCQVGGLAYARNYLILTSAGVTSQHDLYEDLGLGGNARLDPSFNVANLDFNVLNLPANDPTRHLQFECSLSGSTTMYEHARNLSTQSPQVPGMSSSSSASPTTTASRRASAMAMAPITERICTNTDSSTLSDMSKTMENFHIPTWDQLPAEFQNPTTSTGFESTIPLNATTSAMDMSSSAAAAPTMAWDDTELSFDMDMDMDLDFATEMANAGMTQ